MAFCEQCGAELMADAHFCQECGKPVPEPVVETVEDQEIVLDFQMDTVELDSITDMLSDGVQSDQQLLLDLVRQMASDAE